MFLSRPGSVNSLHSRVVKMILTEPGSNDFDLENSGVF